MARLIVFGIDIFAWDIDPSSVRVWLGQLLELIVLRKLANMMSTVFDFCQPLTGLISIVATISKVLSGREPRKIEGRARVERKETALSLFGVE